MDTLWAPWRMTYLENAAPIDCIFCHGQASDQDEQLLILYRGKHAFIQMNLYPYNPGHVMIAPYRHLDTPDKLSSEEQLELFRSIAKSTTLLRHCMHPDGFNIGMNVGKMAGAGFEHHLHIHVVPRWNGDTNFMPVVANTKVIPEDLTVTYRKLATIFRQTLSEGEDDVH